MCTLEQRFSTGGLQSVGGKGARSHTTVHTSLFWSAEIKAAAGFPPTYPPTVTFLQHLFHLFAFPGISNVPPSCAH